MNLTEVRMFGKATVVTGLAMLGVVCGYVNVASAKETKNQSVSEIADEGKLAFDPAAAISGTYSNDTGHSYISFSYLHQGYSRPILRWRAWTSELDWDAENPAASSVSVTIDATSIDTGVDKFDDHLRSDDFFAVDEFSEITFVSTSLEQTGPNTGTLIGNLTVKDITKPVTLYVVFNKAAADNSGKGYKLGFSAKAQVKRSDFGVGAYVPFVGDEVDLVIETEYELKVDAD